jgi:hypothetical protein
MRNIVMGCASSSSSTYPILLLFVVVVTVLFNQQVQSKNITEQIFNIPCCNTCPPPTITIIPIYVTKETIVNIPYPVLKPYPSKFFPNGTCPDGFVRPTPSSNKCIRTIRVTSDVACPNEYFRIGDDTCVRVYIVNVKESLEQILNKVVCPPGYQQPEDGSIACVSQTQTNDTVVPENPSDDSLEEPLTCPDGFLRVSPWRCIKVINCPSEGGYTIAEDGRCMRTRIECPPGYKVVGRTQCIREDITCPVGYQYNNETKSCDKVVIITRCPNDQVDVNGVCKPKNCITVECSPELQCPKGKIWAKANPDDCCASCVPCVCSASFDAVCGSDNVTYPNSCVAKCLQSQIKHQGKCATGDNKDHCTVETKYEDYRPHIVCPDGYTFNAEEKSCILISSSTANHESTTIQVTKTTRPLKEIIIKALERQAAQQEGTTTSGTSEPAPDSNEPETANTLSQITKYAQPLYSRDTLATLNTLDFAF